MDAFAYGLASADQPGFESMDAIWDRGKINMGIGTNKIWFKNTYTSTYYKKKNI